MTVLAPPPRQTGLRRHTELAVALYATGVAPSKLAELKVPELEDLVAHGIAQMGGKKQVTAAANRWQECNRLLLCRQIGVKDHEVTMAREWPDALRLEACLSAARKL